MYAICFYVPIDNAEKVKHAIFAAGAGRIGEYAHCSWQVLGEGQFMPLAGSHAAIGEIGKLEKVPELRVELVCEDDLIQEAVTALKAAHPYETPAYQVIKLESF